LRRWYNANLLAIIVNQPDRRNSNILIDSGPRTAKLRLAAKKSSSNMFIAPLNIPLGGIISPGEII